MLTDRQVYGDLIDIIKNKEHFVLTSNVDGMFERNSLDPSKVYTVQGDMQYIQCLKPCSKQVRSIYPHVLADEVSHRCGLCSRTYRRCFLTSTERLRSSRIMMSFLSALTAAVP